MEFSQLEFFVTVVEEGSFSKAALRVYRTQPAVSIAIRRLEEEIGSPLFERSQKTPVLTDAGELLYDYAKRILSLRDQTFNVVADLESFPVLRDELVLIMQPEHHLAKRKAVKVEELGNQPFLAHNVKTGSRYRVMETFAQHHTPINITLELATVETIKRFVQLKIGLAFVPRMCVADELERGSLVSVPVDDLSYVRTLWVTHRRGMTFSHAAAAFLAILHDHAKTHFSEK